MKTTQILSPLPRKPLQKANTFACTHLQLQKSKAQLKIKAFEIERAENPVEFDETFLQMNRA